MKLTTIATASALAFSAISTAAAQSGSIDASVFDSATQPAASTSSQGSPIQGTPVQERIVESFGEIQLMIQIGQPVEHVLQTLEGLMAEFPTSTSVRQRLVLHVQDLANRARRAYLVESDLYLLRLHTADALMERVLAAVEERAEAGGWTPGQYASVVQHFMDRAEVYSAAPDPAAYRARVAGALFSAASSTTALAQTMGEVRAQFLRIRLEILRRTLLEDMRQGNRSSSDARRVFEASIWRARAIFSDPN